MAFERTLVKVSNLGPESKETKIEARMLAPNGLNYELYEGPNDTVVFLNGMSQSTLHWKSQARAFQSKFRVLTYDAQGQGDSPLSDAELSLAIHSSDLADLLNHLDTAVVHLVGFSHGARVALQFAADYPERVKSLVLCSATATPNALSRTIIRSWREILERGGVQAMSWAALPTILGDRFLGQNEHLLGGIIKASEQRNSRDGLMALLEGMQSYPDLSELARQVSASTLVISADGDLLVTRDGAQELARLTRGRHVEVNGVGHTIPIEAPEEFRELVLGFLSEHA